MQKSEIEIGDRVEVIDDTDGTGGADGYYFQVGCKGVVIGVYRTSDYDTCVSVKFDYCTCRNSELQVWSVTASALKLVD